MTHVTCRLTTKNRDQLRKPTLGNRVWATFTFLLTYRESVERVVDVETGASLLGRQVSVGGWSTDHIASISRTLRLRGVGFSRQVIAAVECPSVEHYETFRILLRCTERRFAGAVLGQNIWGLPPSPPLHYIRSTDSR